MRVNVYAEEITEQVEIVEKTTKDGKFTGLRFMLHLPVTVPIMDGDKLRGYTTHKGPFMHRLDDDDSSAVTFWGKRDMLAVLKKAVEKLEQHYAARDAQGT